MRRFFTVFVLTTSEQRLVVLVMLAFVLGAWLKYHRESNLVEASAPLSETSSAPLVSPTPNDPLGQ